MALSPRGVDNREDTSPLVLRVLLTDSAGEIVTSGTTSLYLYELQDDGDLLSYDFDDNTFKSSALTTETASMTHQTGNNSTTNTGIWTYDLSTVTGFTKGGIYFAMVSHADAYPDVQVREFEWGVEIYDLAARQKAMMSKTASESGLDVGNFDATFDSLEAIRDLLDDMAGAGFVESTDSLEVIRDAIDNLLAPNVTSGTTLSGSGFLSTVVTCVRQRVDEPDTNTKYSDADIIRHFHNAVSSIMQDVNVRTDHPILVLYDVTLVPGQQTYQLPPTVGEVWRIAKINSTTGRPDWEINPTTEFAPGGYGFSIEGSTLRLLRDWQASDTIQAQKRIFTKVRLRYRTLY